MKINPINNSSSSSLQSTQSIQDIINQFNTTLHDWVQNWFATHPNGTASQLQAAFSQERSMLNNQLSSAIQQFATAPGNSWDVWDIINAANPWSAYNNYAASIQSQTIDPMYSNLKPTIPPIPGGGSSISQQIQNAIAQAKAIADELNKAISNYNSTKNTLDSLLKEISDLEQQAQNKPDVQADLQKMQNDVKTLQDTLGQDASVISSLQAFLQPGGSLDQLQAMANIQSPTQADLDKANALLRSMQSAQQTASTLSNLSSLLSQVQADIAKMHADLPTNSEQIQKDYSNAQSAMNQISDQIAQYQQIINSANAIASKISDLQNQINAMADGDQKSQAQAALAKLKSDYAALSGLASDASTKLSGLIAQKNSLSAQLTELSSLSSKTNPTSADVVQAQSDLDKILALQSSVQLFNTSTMGAISSSIATVTSDVKAVETAMKPAPTPSDYEIQNGTWYIDWTMWFDKTVPIPEGVNVVNIFVGKFEDGPNGPTIGGYGTLSEDQIKKFADECHAKGIKVKMSIGGGGGSYDYTWDKLTESNVGDYAKGLYDYCMKNHIDGIDFDYEAFKSTDQEVLVGKLIKEFKDLGPSLETSLCCNAGFGPNYPWQAIVQTIMDAATENGKCALDRLDIMSYYNTLSDEEGWLKGWAQWLKDRYDFCPSRVTVGIDNFDAHAYNVADLAQWAKDQGFSTSYWAWNPTQIDTSNSNTNEIWNIYNKK